MNSEILIAENQHLKERIKSLQEEVDFLKGRIDWFEKQIFGQKRERYIPADDTQTSLDLGKADSKDDEPGTEHVEYDRKKQKRTAAPHGRDEIPAHVPRVSVVIEPDFDTTGMQKIAEKVTEELHYKPAVFYVKQLIRPVFTTIIDGEKTIRCPELPARCIDKGKAGASLVAQTIVTKCVDHNPLYRFNAQIKRYCDLDIPLTTLEGWYARGIFWLETISTRLYELAISHDYVQLDESTIKVMIQPTKGKSHLSYMCLCNAPELKIVTFHYRYTRNCKTIADLVGPTYRGIVQSDGLDLYDQFNTREGIIHAGCAAHARRYFDEALKNDRARAQYALDIWKQLFAVEAFAAEKNLVSSQRLVLRNEKSAPLMTEFKKWIDENILAVTPKSLIGKAIAYSRNRWTELSRFLHDGRIEISNNLIENRVRPFALGRKNWLFAGSEDGARRLAVAYTVMGSCLLNNVNPFEYCADVLDLLPTRKASDIDDLLPMNWKPVRS